MFYLNLLSSIFIYPSGCPKPGGTSADDAVSLGANAGQLHDRGGVGQTCLLRQRQTHWHGQAVPPPVLPLVPRQKDCGSPAQVPVPCHGHR